MNTHQILKQFPNHILFRILHYSLIALQLRDELRGRGKAAVAPRVEWQPFALWLANILLTYAGDILGNMLLGTLPLEPLCNGQDVLFCTIIWYLIFYCPFDMGYAVARTATFRVLATTMTAISQVLLIHKGVHMAGRVYDNALLPMLIIGTIMGSGAEFLKPVASLLINKCQQNNAAYIKLTTNSKLALGISWLYVLERNRSSLLLGMTHQKLQLYMLMALTTFKYMSLAYRTDHMIWLIESRLRYTFFGPLYADLGKFFKRQSAPDIRSKPKPFSKFD